MQESGLFGGDDEAMVVMMCGDGVATAMTTRQEQVAHVKGAVDMCVSIYSTGGAQ